MKTAQPAGGVVTVGSAGGRPFLLSPPVTAQRALCLLVLSIALAGRPAYADSDAVGAVAGAVASAMDVSGGGDDD